MNELVAPPSSAIPLPAPRLGSALSFRLATLADVPRLDALQKPYTKALGFFKSKYFEGYIGMGAVLVAECGGTLVGYCISRDRYLKRDELGVIFQLCVVSGEQRKLVGAALVREVFARSAYGCKLYCLWCARDLEANYFWESMGFLPIAFRAGSKSKGPKGSARVHIFWQRRIREGDVGERATPYWFPAKTEGGAIGEERLVLPIPPGTHWSEVKPVLLPTAGVPEQDRVPGLGSRVPGEKQKRLSGPSRIPNPGTRNPTTRRRVQIGVPTSSPPTPAPAPAPAAKEKKPKPAKAPRQKHDPIHVAKARELRDRYLEHVNGGQLVLASAGKYDVTRQLISDATPSEPKLIAAA